MILSTALAFGAGCAIACIVGLATGWFVAYKAGGARVQQERDLIFSHILWRSRTGRDVSPETIIAAIEANQHYVMPVEERSRGN